MLSCLVIAGHVWLYAPDIRFHPGIRLDSVIAATTVRRLQQPRIELETPTGSYRLPLSESQGRLPAVEVLSRCAADARAQ